MPQLRAPKTIGVSSISVWKGNLMADDLNKTDSDMNGSNSVPRLPNPSEYMRSRHPDLFSDSTERAVPLLKRSDLEYHLETLTSRKQEFIFEEFCRRLAQVEICPNLRPQTGPVGGGDSKTDSSTYPVAEILAERCYWGAPTQPATENWAFAFSCKKRWRQKALDDISKIATLQTHYAKVFFITSQFVKDKSRHELETELSQEHGFDVHILDRNWILDVVFTHKHEELAIVAIGIQVAQQRERILGPQDSVNQSALDALLDRLRSPIEYYANDYSIAADYLDAAKLARNLERPRHEVTGLFQQARRVSKKNGFIPQVIRCAYEHAWADNWWFDDVSTAVEVYSEIEPLLDSIEDSDDVEMFANLQTLLWNGVFRQELNPDDVKLREREDVLRKKLKALSADKLRPNNALYAETMLAFLDFAVWNRESDDVATALVRLADCFQRSRGMSTYPLRRFTDTVVGMSQYIEALNGYDELFETMLKVLAERDGEIAAARLLLQRGEQHLNADRPKEALRLLGQSRIKAAKEEILETAVDAATLAANCYLHLGLVWATKMESLTAAHLACEYVDGVFRSAYYGSRATRLLAWVDLTQGRLAPFLRWMMLVQACGDQLADAGYDLSRFKDVYHDLEVGLCDRLMLLDEKEMTRLLPIADAVQKMGFPMGRFVLLYGAGHSKEIELDFTSAFKEDATWMHDYFNKWREHIRLVANGSKPFSDFGKDACILKTQIMGVKYVIESSPDFGAIVFSENLLAAVEAMLALADWENLAFVTDEIRIRVDVDGNSINPPRPQIVTASGREDIELHWQSDIADWLAYTDRQVVAEYFLSICLEILLRTTIDPLDDLKTEMDKWQKDGGLGRALGTLPTIHAIAHLIGKDCYELDACIDTASS